VQAVVLANTPELVSQISTVSHAFNFPFHLKPRLMLLNIYNEFLKAGTYLTYMHLLSYHEYNKPVSQLRIFCFTLLFILLVDANRKIFDQPI
jgi:hypothetical protein